jgi:hypothetical protein
MVLWLLYLLGLATIDVAQLATLLRRGNHHVIIAVTRLLTAGEAAV